MEVRAVAGGAERPVIPLSLKNGATACRLYMYGCNHQHDQSRNTSPTNKMIIKELGVVMELLFQGRLSFVSLTLSGCNAMSARVAVQ